jgi:hypothetical protein
LESGNGLEFFSELIKYDGSAAGLIMDAPAYAIGQAIFIRTDTPDYEEQIIPFKDLEELVKICSQGHPNLVLEKILVYAMPDGKPCAVTLAFVAATKGQRPEKPIMEI